MSRVFAAAAFSGLLLVGCVDALQDAARPPGQMNEASGRINPCHGWEGDKQLCGDSKYFASVIGGVQIGQSREEVRSLMKRDATRRKVTESEEMWGYPTSYDEERMTWITFRGDKVVAIGESQWDSNDE